MSRNIYIYRLTSDSGNAPCIFEEGYKKTEDLLTLACCKGGQIRNGKIVYTGLRHSIGNNHYKKDDEVYLIGTFENSVLYVAKITDILREEEYYSEKSKYRNRQDCIYEYIGEQNEYWKSFRRRKNFNSKFHPSDEIRLKHDIAGEYVLLSSEFSYFGEKHREIPVESSFGEFAILFPKRQESKHYSDTYESVDLFIEKNK